ncbi:fatty acid synthase alpha subunit Lsd1 [Linderina macrospora]|uniref:Fatty acid synthase alpha subunit Lsd1 n=1 Tax=Linderina macrospora TaxID=4868 RepID=A0ACC1JGE0_9FUNG|nr:fatty acid synthase alpha subunit Lsd1 [Linderina macrospora]
MVSIQGTSRVELEKLIALFNSSRSLPTNQVYLALINSFDMFVVTGRLNVVVQFVHFIRQHCAAPGTDQSRIPFTQRKHVISISYQNSVDWIGKLDDKKNWSYNCGGTQAIPSVKVNGIDISSGINLDEMVACVLFTDLFDWPKTLKGADAAHIVDFSPGGFSTFARLARGIIDGSGVNVISCSSLLAHKNRLLGPKADLFQRDIRSVTRSMDWKRVFSPKLVCVKSSGQVHIDSPMFHALGMPPVMVSAMEPSVTSVHLVAAAINAGYHAELSITGVANASQLHKRVTGLVELIEPGQGITLSCDYSTQEQWSVLFLEILRMRRDGQPITGLSISGSIPPLSPASEIVSSIKDAGLRHITLKASTLEDIRSAIAISKVDHEFPVIMQWMGGRNSGYHSWDDFYQPILETYSLLRFHRNIVLVAGSGVGDMESAIKYVSGQWSVPFGRSPMPFDGVALGSRVLIAKESGLNDAAKQLIADTAGVAANEWTDSSSGVAGGVTSVVGENGQPMHVLATRAALFVKELQDMIFSQPADKQAELIQAKRDYIIHCLNSDYVKPWFGKKADGSVVDT